MGTHAASFRSSNPCLNAYSSLSLNQQEDLARSTAALGQQFLEGLMARTAPACRLPALLAVLSAPAGTYPAGLQVCVCVRARARACV